MTQPEETQVEAAQRMYNTRAPVYEDDFHPGYSKRLMSLVGLKPGDRVLDLACGTGLEAFIAAEGVGSKGFILGVDVAEKMLEIARQRQIREGPRDLGTLKFIYGDATNLSSVKELDDEIEGFDWILCSNAFVLFQNPEHVAQSWKKYLKPGGRLVVDITHEKNLVAGIVIEKACKKAGVPYPLGRQWVQSQDSFTSVLKGEGYIVDKVDLLRDITGHGDTYFSIDQADEQFEWITNRAFTSRVSDTEWREKVQPAFREEWANTAVDGRVENVDALYVYFARKPPAEAA